MKRYIRIAIVVMVLGAATVPTQRANAGVIAIAQLIKAAVKKVIKAADLRIQRLQNKTIWLQNAQKTLENKLSKLKLDQISDWTKKQKEQYRKYYEELAKVKSVISYYQRIREVMQKQSKLVDAYKNAWRLFTKDKTFKPEELAYMEKVYSRILEESLDNIEQIQLVVQSFSTKMSDAKRLELINAAASRIDDNYDALLQFNRHNSILSLQRSKELSDVEKVKKLNGVTD